jgi:HipA-like protein
MLEKLVKKIVGSFNSPSNVTGQGIAPAITISKVLFELKYKEVSIGFLEFSGSQWSFYYAESFKIQNEIAPIISFPNKELKYHGTELWSFFASRIPDNTSSESSDTFKKSNENLVDQLKSYGRKTITNPFDLSVA